MSTDSAMIAQFFSLEYTTLKQEIYGRSRDQLICVTTSLVSIGALISAVTTDPSQFLSLLLIAPWILSIFGIMWCDHHNGIHVIGAYLKELEMQMLLDRNLPDYSSLTTSLQVNSELLIPMTWETWINRSRRVRRKDAIRKTSSFVHQIHKTLPLFYYFLPSVGTLVTYYSIKNTKSTVLPFFLEISIAIFDVCLIFLFLLWWYQACISAEY